MLPKVSLMRRISSHLLYSTLLFTLACGESDDGREDGNDDGGVGNLTDGDDSAGSDDGTTGTTGDDDGGFDGGVEEGDGGTDDPPPFDDCNDPDAKCNQIDLLFVIDNSGTMGEEQINLAKNFPLLIEQLQGLENSLGQPVNADVNIMVTTTDLAHPTCEKQNQDPEINPNPDYVPSKGSPISNACTERLDDFTGLGAMAPSFPEACTDSCESPIVPDGNFIHFDGAGTNVTNDDVPGALSCIGPQGINGCGYEAPLEAMMQAINPGAEWNTGDKPFLRDEAVLAIAIVTDEADCSVNPQTGYGYFSNDETYWATLPQSEMKWPSSSICWNGGVECDPDPDNPGYYKDCVSVENDVLHPITRYIDYLKGELVEKQNKEVIMLGILGVPEVTAHNPEAPYEPTDGGVKTLEYRDWTEADIIPGSGYSTEQGAFDFGIGPGCTGGNETDGFRGQAIPPVRVKEVCESLDTEDGIRCCIESICDDDFSPAIRCLTGLIQETIIIG